jgi:hypothetical protein
LFNLRTLFDTSSEILALRNHFGKLGITEQKCFSGTDFLSTMKDKINISKNMSSQVSERLIQ